MEEVKSHNNSFNHEFCTKLEDRITRDFKISAEPELKNFWCDGVLHSPYYNDDDNYEYLLFENVKERGEIKTISWNGLDGQTEYKTTIHLGNKSLELYELGIDLSESLPKEENENWLEIDIEAKTLKIYLD